MTKNKPRLPAPPVIVIGDWVVDEYWFLVRHHSRIASHTGFVHYRLSSAPRDTVADLCGAGHVARILFELKKEQGSDGELVGLGNWNHNDQDLISHLIHARNNDDCEANAAGFRFMKQMCDSPPDITLHTLAPEGPTIRVIRQYHRQRGGLEQLNRVDWELEENNQPERRLSDLQLPSSEKKSFIVVNDLRKGVVDGGLIAQVLEAFPDSTWCVRSKDHNPSWLSDVDHRLALLVIAPEVTAKLNPWDTWLTHGRIGKHALETINALPGRNVVLLSNHREVACHLGRGHKDQCIAAQASKPWTPITHLGWPTSIFAILAHRLIAKGGELKSTDVDYAVGRADEFSGVTVPGSRASAQTSIAPAQKSTPTSWEDESTEWAKSTSTRYGFLKRGGETHLDVWRGFTFLPG